MEETVLTLRSIQPPSALLPPDELTVAPDPEALIEEARARQRRRRVWLSSVALLVGLVVAVAVALLGGSNPHSLTLGQVTSLEAAAVQNHRGFIVRLQARSHPPAAFYTSAGVAKMTFLNHCLGCFTVTWVNPSSGRVRRLDTTPAGAPLRQETDVYRSNGREVMTGEIDYRARRWLNYLGGLREGSGPQGPGALAQAELGPLGSAPLHGGMWVYRFVATVQVRGQRSVELQGRLTGKVIARAAAHGAKPSELRYLHAQRLNVWISTTTGLPLREQLRTGSTSGTTTDLTWLAPTRANYRLLTLQSPPAFTHQTLRCDPIRLVCHPIHE